MGRAMDHRTRLVQRNELASLLSLYKHLHESDSEPPEDTLSSLWDEICNDPNMYIFLVEVDGVLVSSCVLAMIRNLTRGARPYGVIKNVVTHGAHRKKGYGKAVLTAALKRAWERNCYKVMLLTGRKDEGTLRIYEEVGFVGGMKTGFVAYPDA